MWVTAMQKEPALAAQVKKRFEECTPQEAADVLLIGSYQRVRIVVPLKAYEEFVFDAIIKHQWDISEWPERTQWISRMLQHIWLQANMGTRVRTRSYFIHNVVLFGIHGQKTYLGTGRTVCISRSACVEH